MSESRSTLQFLKLGGSLITDKNRPHTPRLEVLARLANEVAAAHRRFPELKLVLGHGSGSFGHVPAQRYNTRRGVHTQIEWQGFIEVWREAAALNRFVLDAFAEAGLPVIAFPPSASLTARDGRVASWDISPLISALRVDLVPVVYGDVVFDQARGGTIFSTEDLFDYLARQLRPGRILLAGLEPGVWADYPRCTHLVTEITPENLAQIIPALGGSAATDVTGGMYSKVQQSLALVQAVPGLEVRIFSAEMPGMILRALAGDPLGTLIHTA